MEAEFNIQYIHPLIIRIIEFPLSPWQLKKAGIR